MIAQDASPLDFALEYARAGWPILPVKPRDKIPLTAHGAHDATTDSTTIKRWWAQWPDANIGFALDGLVAVDVDPRNGGDLDSLPYKLPDTCTARTGGNGSHHVFRAANGTKYAAHPAPGIDVKSGAGHYIVVEPSIHPSGGRYCWLDESEPWRQRPAEAPDWLAEQVSKDNVATKAEGTFFEGQRNSGLASVAGSLVRLGLSQAEIAATLTAANRDRCRPPLPESEVANIARSIAQYRETHEAARIGPLWPDCADLKALDAIEPEAPSVVMVGLPEGYSSGNFGHGGAGKSTIELIRFVCIAAGIEYCGLPVERRLALYLSGEDRLGHLHWRLSRICKALGITMRSLDGWLRIVDLVGRDTVIYQPNASGSFTAAYGALMALIEATGAEVVCYDGVSDFYGGNENERSQVKRFNNLIVGAPGKRAPRVASMLVGHIAKNAARNASLGEAYAGSTQWHNAVRSRWATTPEREEDGDGSSRATGRIIVTNEKSNLGDVGLALVFKWDALANTFIGERVAPESSPGIYGTLQRNAERRAILDAIRAASASGYVPAATTGRMSAFVALRDREGLPSALASGNRAAVGRFYRHLSELQASGALVLAGFVKPNRHVVNILAPPDLVADTPNGPRLRRNAQGAPQDDGERTG